MEVQRKKINISAQSRLASTDQSLNTIYLVDFRQIFPSVSRLSADSQQGPGIVCLLKLSS